MEISRRHLLGLERSEHADLGRLLGLSRAPAEPHNAEIEAKVEELYKQYPALPDEVVAKLRQDLSDAYAERDAELQKRLDGMTRNQRRVYKKQMAKKAKRK